MYVPHSTRCVCKLNATQRRATCWLLVVGCRLLVASASALGIGMLRTCSMRTAGCHVLVLGVVATCRLQACLPLLSFMPAINSCPHPVACNPQPLSARTVAAEVQCSVARSTATTIKLAKSYWPNKSLQFNKLSNYRNIFSTLSSHLFFLQRVT